VTYGFGTKFRKLGPLPDSVNREELDRLLSSQKMPDFSKPVVIDGQSYTWEPYDFSWRWGMEGDPGHQGYHGLKENISDDFIGLGKPEEKFNEILYTKEEEGTCYYLWTSAFAEKSGRATFRMDGLKPEAIFLNHKKINDVSSYQELKKGGNPLLLRYNNPGRGHFVVTGEETPGTGERTPLSMKWNDLKSRVAFDVLPEDKRPAGWYRFTAPPGLKAMTLTVTGSIKAWIDGKPAPVSRMTSGCPAQYRIVLDQSVPERSKVALRVEQARGDYGGSVFPEPVLLDCEAGISGTGDWSEGSVLECYSGGAWYRKIISLSKAQAASEVMLDLGEVVATAEVRINGKTAGVLVSPPWKLDLSHHVREGENRLEILVYNTLANHYVTIPTRYRGDSLKSGLIGPVRLEITPR
jgi:hypothetical protein